MSTAAKVLGLLALAFLLPACGRSKPPQYTIANLPYVGYNPGAVTISAQNNDAVAYDLSIREYTSGTLSAQVDMIWPLLPASGGSPGTGEGSWIVNDDSATITHAVVIFDPNNGLLLDQKPYVKGAVPITVFVTVTGGAMTVTTSP